MKTKLLMLMALFLLIPFVSADAGLITLTKVKKAGEIWLRGGDDFGVSDWAVEDFDGAAKLSGKSNPNSRSVEVSFDKNQNFTFAVFKRNAKLKYWGVAEYDNGAYSLRKERKKSFIPTDWVFKKVVSVNREAPADTNEGNVPAESAPEGADNNSVGGSEGKVALEEETIILADLPKNANEGNVAPANNGPAPISEPATMLLLGGGLIGLGRRGPQEGETGPKAVRPGAPATACGTTETRALAGWRNPPRFLFIRSPRRSRRCRARGARRPPRDRPCDIPPPCV